MIENDFICECYKEFLWRCMYVYMYVDSSLEATYADAQVHCRQEVL